MVALPDYQSSIFFKYSLLTLYCDSGKKGGKSQTIVMNGFHTFAICKVNSLVKPVARHARVSLT